MNGFLVINKPKDVTSRDVVNEIGKILNTKRIGHTGTLDPIATGVLVLCVGKATKLVDIITSETKEYLATVKLGFLTDTLDITGNVLEQRLCSVNKEELIKVLNSFIGEYNQEVPIYSAVKIKGKKLYEYAREGKIVDLPIRKVRIIEIELIDFKKDSYSFRVVVSKGTYIRSLIKDINDKLNIIGVMSDLKRTKQGMYHINDSYDIDDVLTGNYKMLSLSYALKDYYKVEINDELYKKVINGSIIKNVYNKDMVVFLYHDEVVAMYKKYDKKDGYMKPYKMFTGD